MKIETKTNKQKNNIETKWQMNFKSLLKSSVVSASRMNHIKEYQGFEDKVEGVEHSKPVEKKSQTSTLLGGRWWKGRG